MMVHSVIQEPFPGLKEVGYYKNVYVDLQGVIHPTPFNMPVTGLWYFDGQIYYQRISPSVGR